MKCLSSTFASFRPFEAWLQLEVGLAAVDGDEQLGPLQPPLAQEQRQHQLGLRVVRKPDVLEWGDKRKTIQTDLSVYAFCSGPVLPVSGIESSTASLELKKREVPLG